MTAFSYIATLSEGGEPFHTGITDLQADWIDGQAFLFAISGPDGGLTAWQIDTLAVTFVDQVSYGAGVYTASPNAMFVGELSGSTHIAPLGPSASGLLGHGVQSGGDIQGASVLTAGPGLADSPTAMTTWQSGANAYVFTAHVGDDAILTWRDQGDGTFAQVGQSTITTTYQGAAVPQIAQVDVAGTPLLLTLNAVDNTLTSFAVDPDGALTALSYISAGEGLGIDSPTGFVTAQIDGNTYAVIAGSGSSSLSVVQVDSDGMIRPVDHILDDQITRFGAVQDIDITTINGRTFIAAGGGDDGISLFELLPGGTLLGMASIEDSLTTPLNNVQAIELVALGGGLQVFASSGTEAGIGHYGIDLGTLIAPQIGNSTSETLSGTGFDDLILGGAGNDTIDGQAGDDVIVDGSGDDHLTGGTGADVFVITAGEAIDRILDFEAGIDALDLSDFDMFYGLDQLDITSTSTGAQLRYRDNLIVVTSANGTSLNAAHFAATSVVSVTRPPLMAVEAGRSVPGTSGGDTQIGATGHDTLIGSLGSDTLNGAEGTDLVDYGASPGPVLASLSLGFGWAGFAQGDVYLGIENLSGSAWDDMLAGNAEPNTLLGGGGHDRLFGLDGNDTLSGGDGDDFLASGSGEDEADSGDGRDTVHGAAGNDTLSSGADADQVYGGQGADYISGGDGNDRLTGGNDADSVYGGAGSDIVIGQAGDDVLFGDDGNDTLSGGYGDDTLFGGQGADRIVGHFGNDQIEGGAGDDTLFGGSGEDVFIFRAGDGRDRIQDFDVSLDTMMVSGEIWGGGLSAMQVVESYGNDQNDTFSLVMGGGHQITFNGISNADDIVDALVIF